MTTYKTWIYDGRGHRRMLYEGRSQAKAYDIQNTAAETLEAVNASGRVQTAGHRGCLSGELLRTIDLRDGVVQNQPPDPGKPFKLAIPAGDVDTDEKRAWQRFDRASGGRA